MTGRLPFLLVLAAALVLIQQQVLLRRSPRLVTLSQQQIHSGSAALDLRFSRPMHRNNVSSESRLVPALNHRWLGANNPLRLVIDADQVIPGPLKLELAGRDQRLNPMVPQTWWWALVAGDAAGGRRGEFSFSIMTGAGDHSARLGSASPS